jgi:tetratricopeptide (TPR) repeat protein
MPSPLGHAIAGVAAGWLVAGAPRSLGDREAARTAGVFATLGMLPDVDLLFGMHSGPTHGVGSAMVIGAIALVTARRAAVPHARQFALACLAAYLSHTLLDWLGTDASPPLGIMALWPFSRAYYESDLHLFMAISRRYYQGWAFVWQNVRAVGLELVILAPVLALVYLVRRRGALAVVVTAVGLLMVAPAGVARSEAAAQLPPMLRDSTPGVLDAILADYRAGAIDASIAALAMLLADDDGSRRVSAWVTKAHEWNRREDLEAALLLFSEAVVAIWKADAPFPEGRLPPYSAALRQSYRLLRDLDRRTPFLRAWYLMWESFRQATVYHALPPELDYVDEALEDFPKDARILLATGSRHELNWWTSPYNARRNLSTQPLYVTRSLVAARDWLRRSVSADPNEAEARLRLIHVYLELDDLGPIAALLGSHDWSREQPAFRYLAALFDGDLHERKGDHAAAAAAYERASRLTGRPQSALVARAYVGHAHDERLDAARTVERAIGDWPDELDPWWLFIQGQAWRFDAYLKTARHMVMR